jgi:hypothetical protein
LLALLPGFRCCFSENTSAAVTGRETLSLSAVNIDRQSDDNQRVAVVRWKTLFSTGLSLLKAPGNPEKKPPRIRYLLG